MRRFILVTALLSLAFPSMASAQDAQKFSAYQATLQQRVAPLPIFQPEKKGSNEGAVVDNEVIVSFNEISKQYQAVYVVLSPIQAVLGFYKEKLGVEAKKTGSEVLGDVLYTFRAPFKEADSHVLEVQLRPLTASGKKVQISLMKRAATFLDAREY